MCLLLLERDNDMYMIFLITPVAVALGYLGKLESTAGVVGKAYIYYMRRARHCFSNQQPRVCVCGYLPVIVYS